jgi:Na+-driven multidrug efflux pump
MAVHMPIHAISHGCYFTLRSGGRTFITILFDSVYAFVIVYPFAAALCYLTNIPIIPLYFACQSIEIGKCIMGGIMVGKRIWVRNIVADKKEA